MINDLLRALRKREHAPPVEMLDAETLRSRIGDPLPPRKGPKPEDEYIRSDGRPPQEHSWRKTAGLTR